MSLVKKILALVLLFLGLAIIFYSLYSSFCIFTARSSAPEVFSLSAESSKTGTVGGDIQAQIQQMIGEQLKGILPLDSIPKLLNLTVWSIFAGILIFGGAQISTLGIKLMRT